MEEVEDNTNGKVVSWPEGGIPVWNGYTTAIVGAVYGVAIAAMSMVSSSGQ